MKQKSPGSKWVNFLLGVALMFGGTYMSVNIKLPFIEKLNEQGIPLDLGKTIAVVGVLLILFPVIKGFYLNPLIEAIQSRNSELEKTFSEAVELREQMNTMKSEYEQRLAATEASAREQIQAQIREAQNLRTQLMAEAHAQKEEMVKKAQEEIEAEKNRVLVDLRMEVVNLTLSATERILGENVDDAKNRKLVEDFISKVEAPA